MLLTALFLLGLLAVAYSQWTKPLREAERALARGETEAGLDAYAAAEARYGRFTVTRYLFAAWHADAVYNQLFLLYRAGDYPAVIDKAAIAPPGAAPRFWAGTAFVARALAEQNSEMRLRWVTAAEQELGQALKAAPDDWNTKFNYEIAARLGAGLRREPTMPKDLLMQLLRPTPAETAAPRKVG